MENSFVPRSVHIVLDKILISFFIQLKSLELTLRNKTWKQKQFSLQQGVVRQNVLG
ncbi:hypothetical protein T190607A01A_10620 [Tenacibaculum sp. 190524A05c]|uniref:Uncharacterized protein n=1 Tax=Tenacibaculum platacis TaxID=3137852 RepID=A0ABP1EFG6_9FLAO